MKYRRMPVTFVAIVFLVVACSAAVVVASLLVWHMQSSDHRQAERRAALERALPVVEMAFQATLARNPGIPAKAQPQRLKQGWPGAYLQFVTVLEPNSGPILDWGHDFTWRGKRYHWPKNPYTGEPMTQGTRPGDFSVRFIWYGYVSGDPETFELTIHGGRGQPDLSVTASSPTIPIETSGGQGS